MIINNVDSKIFQLSKLSLGDKINILEAYRASKSIIIRNSGGGGGAVPEAGWSPLPRQMVLSIRTKKLRSFSPDLKGNTDTRNLFFDMQKMVRLKFSQLSSYNLNSCVENVCGKEQMEIEKK